MALALQDDPRWQRFNDQGYVCPCCGRTFGGIFDIGFRVPSPWPHGLPPENTTGVWRVGDDSLSGDICRVGAHRFVRGIVELPIIGSGESFAFGAWASLHPDRFDDYVAAYGTDREGDLGRCFGWLSNELPGYSDDRFLQVDVIFRGGSDRPLFLAHHDEMPLARDQREGISFDALLDLYARCCHDIRSHLDQH